LTINGAPVGRELGRYYLKDELERTQSRSRPLVVPPTPQIKPEPGLNSADGSVIIVIATDAPIDHRNLQRLAARSMMGLARTGARVRTEAVTMQCVLDCAGTAHSRYRKRSQFEIERRVALKRSHVAVVSRSDRSNEEAIYNSLFRATTMSGRATTVEALPYSAHSNPAQAWRTLEVSDLS